MRKSSTFLASDYVTYVWHANRRHRNAGGAEGAAFVCRAQACQYLHLHEYTQCNLYRAHRARLLVWQSNRHLDLTNMCQHKPIHLYANYVRRYIGR